jgi:transcription elongation GreA/GreB family factor
MLPDTLIRIGSRVTVRDQDGSVNDFTIVRLGEGDITSGRISDASPLAAALIGHRTGERVRVRAPGGHRNVTILGVS